MKLSFFGAAGGVTGSKYLLETQSTRVLIECGLFQGLKSGRLLNWKSPPFDPISLDGIVLTHAHIDHSGYIPIVVRDGFSQRIHATEPTIDLCRILLPDSGRIQEEDANFANRKGFSKHQPALPLYTEDQAIKSLSYFKKEALQKPFVIGDISFEFHSAGHILGAANVTATTAEGSIMFSGDVGRYADMVEHQPSPHPGGDWVVMETTYGDRLHSDVNVFAELGRLMSRVNGRGGVMVIPSFAVGRTQELLYCIKEVYRRKLAPRVPVFVDSPMASKTSQLYLDHPEWHQLSHEDCFEAFKVAKFVSDVEESRSLNTRKGPFIIISSSGMITGGRILHHVKHHGDDPRNMILLAGFQAPGTRGALLAAGSRSLKIHGQYLNILAEVIQSDYFSAHADQQQLLAWLMESEKMPGKVFLTHGEPQAADAFRRLVIENLKCDVVIPSLNQVAVFP